MFPKVCFTSRSVMIFVLFAAIGTFAVQATVAYRMYENSEKDIAKRAQEFNDRQDELDARLARIEALSKEEKRLFDARILEIVSRQDTLGNEVREASTHSPFPIDAVLPSIAELVCLDNTQKDIYYTGSGTVIAGDGLIVTNRHLLTSSDGTFIRYCGVGFTGDIQDPPSIEFVAEAAAFHEHTDLAILKIIERLDGEEMQESFAALNIVNGDASKNVGIGDPIFIAGYPGVGAETFTFTEGVVSGRVGTELIKTSALIDSGTSGGAAFRSDGAYVGVPTAAARGDIGGSLGYLISAHVVDAFLVEYYSGIAHLEENNLP